MTTCSVKVQKENGVKLYDEECGQFVFKSKFCEKHYIEHLGYLMFKYNVDPVDNLDLVELRKLLARHNIAHSSQATKLQLVQVVKEKLPIKKSVPTVRQLLGTGNCSQSASYTTPASSSYY
ncbi:hypothetical protein HDE_05626 [Halotydeus destructor]|nr:hypothetical protein HDE_05626 [Halotydeus destructor]